MRGHETGGLWACAPGPSLEPPLYRPTVFSILGRAR